MNVYRRVLLGVSFLLVWGVFGVRILAAQAAAAANAETVSSPDPDQEQLGAAPATGGHHGDKVAGGLLGPDYVLGPEDVLVIEVFNLPEMRQAWHTRKAEKAFGPPRSLRRSWRRSGARTTLRIRT